MTVMHVLRSRELAIEVACRFFDLGRHDALEVGPMLGPREENVLDHSAIQQIHETWPTSKTGTHLEISVRQSLKRGDHRTGRGGSLRSPDQRSRSLR